MAFLCCVLFSQCKKDGQAAPEPEKETWQALPDDLIDISARRICTSYADSQHLMFFSYNASYIFDSSFSGSGSYDYLFNAPGYLDNDLIYKAGPRFRVFNIQNIIVMTANQQPSSSSRSSLSAAEVAGTTGTVSDFTAPDVEDNFYAVLTTGESSGTADQSFLLCKYHLSHEQNITVNKNLLWKVVLANNISGQNNQILAINAAGNAAFVTTADQTYRVENGIVTDSTAICLRNMVQFKQFYVATCSYRATQQQEYPTGLVYSNDEGRTWQYIGTGDSFGPARLITFGDKLFLNTGTQLALIDFESGTLTPLLRSADINAYIWTANLFHDKVYIGTDAGVYCKSLEGFLHPE